MRPRAGPDEGSGSPRHRIRRPGVTPRPASPPEFRVFKLHGAASAESCFTAPTVPSGAESCPPFPASDSKQNREFTLVESDRKRQCLWER